MLDSIMGMVKDQVLKSITGEKIEIPADKKDDIVDETTNTMVDSMKSNFTLDNLTSLSSLFGNSGSAGSSSLSSTIQNTLVASLAEKVGIDKALAQKIAAVAVPAVMNMFQTKVNDPKDSSISIESLVTAFAGSKDGGVLGMLGGLFGK